MTTTKAPQAFCQRCGKRIAKGPGRCARCLGMPLRPGWQRRPCYVDPDDALDASAGQKAATPV
jgi:predicted amidophosphoribosyltransferase